jgi:hypothetical protein
LRISGLFRIRALTIQLNPQNRNQRYEKDRTKGAQLPRTRKDVYLPSKEKEKEKMSTLICVKRGTCKQRQT